MPTPTILAARIEVGTAAKHVAAAASLCPKDAAAHLRVVTGILSEVNAMLEELASAERLAAVGIIPMPATTFAPAPAPAVELAHA